MKAQVKWCPQPNSKYEGGKPSLERRTTTDGHEDCAHAQSPFIISRMASQTHRFHKRFTFTNASLSQTFHFHKRVAFKKASLSQMRRFHKRVAFTNASISQTRHFHKRVIFTNAPLSQTRHIVINCISKASSACSYIFNNMTRYNIIQLLFVSLQHY